MKLIEIIAKLDKSKNNQVQWIDSESFCEQFGIPEYSYINFEKTDISAFWIKKWECTDTHVGEIAYFYKNRFVAVSYQPYRKSSETFKWVTKDAFLDVKAYCESLLDIKETYIDILDIDEEYGDSYDINHATEVLDKTVIYNETNEVCEVVKHYNNYNEPKWNTIDIKFPNGNILNVKADEFKIKYPITK